MVRLTKFGPKWGGNEVGRKRFRAKNKGGSEVAIMEVEVGGATLSCLPRLPVAHQIKGAPLVNISSGALGLVRHR